MKFLGVIPARYSSTRLIGKLLKKIDGHTILEWVYKRALVSNLDRVIIATDDMRIMEEVEKFGGEAILTDSSHINGTSRIIEVCSKITDYDIVINIQGDEPLIEPTMINQIIDAFKKEDIQMCTLKHKFKNLEDVKNPNNVKVITDINNNALYFSRSVIPYPREEAIDFYKHIGIYGYTREFLLKYSNMKPSNLEKTESLEQLRVLENGYKIKVIETPYEVIGIDTEEDYQKIINYVKNNNISLTKGVRNVK